MPTLTDVTFAKRDLSPAWRAAVVILTTRFGRDTEVWEHVIPGDSIDLMPLLADRRRRQADRLLLAVAQQLAAPDSITVQLAPVMELDDRRLRIVLDALAIARGSLPVD